MLGRYGDAEDGGARMVAGPGADVDIAATVALFAIHGTTTVVVRFAIAVEYRCARNLAVVIHFQDCCLRCTPGWKLPRDASEALDTEAFTLPLATWLPGSVECS